MASEVVYKAMVDQAMAAVRSDVETYKVKRGTQFKISDAKPYVDAVNGMKAVETLIMRSSRA